jgi:CIC family chloride channel protein
MDSDRGASSLSSEKDARAEARSEIEEFLEVRHEQHKLFPRAAVVGLCAGAVAVIFRALLAAADALRNQLVESAHALPVLGWVFPVLFAASGASVAAVLVFRYAPEAGGSGIPHLKAVLHRLRNLFWRRVLAVKMSTAFSPSAAAWPWRARARPCKWASAQRMALTTRMPCQFSRRQRQTSRR